MKVTNPVSKIEKPETNPGDWTCFVELRDSLEIWDSGIDYESAIRMEKDAKAHGFNKVWIEKCSPEAAFDKTQRW